MAKHRKPIDLKPLAEGIRVLTNEIDTATTVIDVEGLYEKFDFYTKAVNENGSPDDYQKAAIVLSKKAKSSGGVLASYHKRAKKNEVGFKALMVKKDFDVSGVGITNKTDSSYSNRLRDWILHHLICNGVNGVSKVLDEDGYGKAFTCEERYYRIISAKPWKSGDVTQIVTVHSQLESDWGVATSKRRHGGLLPLALSSSTRTFTNSESVENSRIREKRKRQLMASERFRLTPDFVVPVYNDRTGKLESTISDGEFIECAIGKRKNRVSAYHVDHKALTDTQKTRAGIMFEHLRQMNDVYGSSVNIKLKWREFDTVYKYSDLYNAKECEYVQIVEALSGSTLKVVNKSSVEISDKIKKGLADVCGDISIIYGNRVDDGDLVLLCVDSEITYKDKVDPYKEFKANNPEVVSQAVVMATLQEKRNVAPVLQCDLAQLLVKKEIMEGKFLMERCETPSGVWFIEAVRVTKNIIDDYDDEVEGDPDDEDCFEYYRGMASGNHIEFAKLTDSEVDKLKNLMGSDGDLLFGRKKNDGTYTKNRNPVAYYPGTGKYMVFTETGRSVIPDHELIDGYRSDLVHGSNQAVGREWFEGYVANPEAREKPKTAIEKMLAENPNANAFSKQTVFAALGSMRGDNRDHAPNMIYKDLGIRWIDVAQKESGKDLVKHQRGFNFSYKNKMYYAGSVGSHDNSSQECFCRLYEITTNLNELPAGMHEWFLSFSVRNKQTTAKPYFFKHVREFAKIDRFKPIAAIQAPDLFGDVGKEEFDPLAALAKIH